MSTAGATESTTSKSLAVTSLTIPGGGTSDLEASMSSSEDPGEGLDSITPLSAVDDEMDGSSKIRHRTMKSSSAIGVAMMPGMSEMLMGSRSAADMAGEMKSDSAATASREEERKIHEETDETGPFKPRQRAQSAKDLRAFLNATSARLTNPWGIVTEPDATGVLVRGATYPDDKVKIKSKPRLCPLVGVECWKTTTRIDHIAQSEWSTWYSENIDPLDESVFVIIMHLQVESIGACFIHYHILEGGLPARTECKEFNSLFNQLVRSADYPGPEVLNGGSSSSGSSSTSSSSSSAASSATSATIKVTGAGSEKVHKWDDEAARERYDLECDDYRRNRLKLIPKLVKGPWVVKKMVQNTPCILGKAVAHRYFRGPNYLEIDAQVDESYVSASIIKMCHSYSTSIVVDMYWTIEGVDTGNELPERIMMGCTIHKLDFSKTSEMVRKSDKTEHKSKRRGGTSRDFSRDALRLEQ